MGKIILKDNTEIESDEMFEFNAALKSNNDNISSFEFTHFDKICKVDFINQSLSIDGVEIEKIEEPLTNLRWVNFRRTRIDLVMLGDSKKINYSYGFGFQGNKGNENIKCVRIIENT